MMAGGGRRIPRCPPPGPPGPGASCGPPWPLPGPSWANNRALAPTVAVSNNNLVVIFISVFLSFHFVLVASRRPPHQPRCSNRISERRKIYHRPTLKEATLRGREGRKEKPAFHRLPEPSTGFQDLPTTFA